MSSEYSVEEVEFSVISDDDVDSSSESEDCSPTQTYRTLDVRQGTEIAKTAKPEQRSNPAPRKPSVLTLNATKATLHNNSYTNNYYTNNNTNNNL